MQQTHHDKILDVDGYEVSASFADTVNTDAITHVKQILISSFVNLDLLKILSLASLEDLVLAYERKFLN